MRRRGLQFVLPLLILALAVGLRLGPVTAPLLERFFLVTVDLYQRWAPRPYEPAPVRIVTIDDAGLEEFGQWPWPRPLLARLVDALDLPDRVLTRDRATPLEAFAGFLALESPRAGELQRALAAEGVASDSRGRFLRLGPAPYLADAQLEEAVARLGRVCVEAPRIVASD
jgi:hypothetical protein